MCVRKVVNKPFVVENVLKHYCNQSTGKNLQSKFFIKCFEQKKIIDTLFVDKISIRYVDKGRFMKNFGSFHTQRLCDSCSELPTS